MYIMQLTINIDETLFKDVIEKELNAFSSEELHEIIRSCIVEALKNDVDLKSLFVAPKSYSYEPSRASELMITAAKGIDLSPAYKEIQDMMITELKTNYVKLMQSVMLNLMVDGLCDSYGFQQALSDAVRHAINVINSSRD